MCVDTKHRKTLFGGLL